MQGESGVIKHSLTKKKYLAGLKLSSVLQQKKSKEYTTIVLTFFALTVFGIFAINPTLTTIVQLRKQLDDSRLLDQRLNEKVTALQTLLREYDELAPDLPLIEAAIPVKPEAPTLVAKLQSLFRTHDLTVREITMEKVPYTKDGLAEGTLGSWKSSFQVSGSFSDIAAFLSDAMNDDRLLTIDQVSLARDSQNPNIISATIDIRGYFDQAPL